MDNSCVFIGDQLFKSSGWLRPAGIPVGTAKNNIIIAVAG